MKRFSLTFFQKNGRVGGQKKGPTKARGNSDYYRKLAKIGHEKRKAKNE